MISYSPGGFLAGDMCICVGYELMKHLRLIGVRWVASIDAGHVQSPSPLKCLTVSRDWGGINGLLAPKTIAVSLLTCRRVRSWYLRVRDAGDSGEVKQAPKTLRKGIPFSQAQVAATRPFRPEPSSAGLRYPAPLPCPSCNTANGWLTMFSNPGSVRKFRYTRDDREKPTSVCRRLDLRLSSKNRETGKELHNNHHNT